MPFGVAIGTLPGSPSIRPPAFGALATRAHPAPSATTALAVDLDVDALDAMLFELWRTGWLDRRLAEVGLDRRFNADPIVTEYLSVRISPVRLALPPVIAPASGALRLTTEARVTIADGATATIGRVWGALDFRFTGGPHLPIAVDLGALELSCERTPTTLVPCYGDLVAAFRGRGAELHGALTEAFAKLLADVFVDRELATTGLPFALAIHGVTPSLAAGGTLHLELDASLSPTR